MKTKINLKNTETGLEAIERLRFLSAWYRQEGGRRENATFPSLPFPPRYIILGARVLIICGCRVSIRKVPLVRPPHVLHCRGEVPRGEERRHSKLVQLCPPPGSKSWIWLLLPAVILEVERTQQKAKQGEIAEIDIYTGWCRFLSQEVREISRFFVAPPTRVRPRPPRNISGAKIKFLLINLHHE